MVGNCFPFAIVTYSSSYDVVEQHQSPWEPALYPGQKPPQLKELSS